jgi:molybdopterin molybdotransferase
MWEAQRDGQNVTIARPFPPGFFIEQRGEDLKKDDVVCKAGTELGPWEVGLLAGLGISEVSVTRIPEVAIFSSGDEVIPYDQPLKPGRIRDGNAVMLAAAISDAGGRATFKGIMRDDFDAFREALSAALDAHDMVVISGGTAVGGRDFISDLMRETGELIVDGVPMRSGRPLIVGVARGKPMIGVAGHPPEALRGFRLFGTLALDRILGRERPLPADTPT